MSAPFADLQAGLAGEILASLANATAVIGGRSVVGIFGAARSEAFSGLAGGSLPQFRAATADLSSVVVGTALTIDGTAYQVAEKFADGNAPGLVALTLDKT